jgi:PAS domain S-box-containing protein
MKLSIRFLLLPLVLAVFSGLFYSAYKEVRNKTLNEFNTQQFTLASQASRGIESFFIYYQRELTFLSKLEYVSNLNDQGRNLLADFYRNHSDQIEAITLVDSKGILQYTYPLNDSALGKDISDQPHVKEIMANHKPIVSNVFTSVQGFKTIAYHVPVFIGNEYKGSIAILIPIDNLGKRFVENIRTGETGYGWLINETGIQLFNPSSGQTGQLVNDFFKNSPSVKAMLAETLKNNEGTAICDVNGVKTHAVYYRVSLGNTFWTIIIFSPEREIYARLMSFRNKLFLLILAIIIVIGVYFHLSLKASDILAEAKKRKAIEKILTDSENRFRIMFELSPAGIILIDETGKIIEANSAFSENMGYAREEIIGKNIRLFASPRTDGEIEDNVSRILSGNTLIHEVRNTRKDGTQCDIELYETMISLPDGKPGILSVSNDITEKKLSNEMRLAERKLFETELIKAKDKAEESDRLKSAFLANMSHELRTPLNAIIGFSGMMIESGPDQNTLPFSKIILSSGQQLLRMVEDIFDSTMIETGQLKLNYEKTDLVSLLKEVRDMMLAERLKENKKEVDLCLNLDSSGETDIIVTDSRKLKQVLINLLRNAVKFTDKGFIEFGFERIIETGEDYFQFYVKDTGIGIDKSYHDAIFNIFRQIDDTHTRKFGGMGIGLSIAKKTVELMGGKIWVESEYSRGSVFYFTIPVTTNALLEISEPEIKPMKQVKSFSGKTVLVAEDERSNYDFLSILLIRMDINVLWAKNGKEAVSLCDTDPSIDLVLMDIKMPLLNGLDATRVIKKKRPLLPVIAQSAYAMNSDKQEAEEAGCDGYLTKPIKISEITDLIESYFL